MTAQYPQRPPIAGQNLADRGLHLQIADGKFHARSAKFRRLQVPRPLCGRLWPARTRVDEPGIRRATAF